MELETSAMIGEGEKADDNNATAIKQNPNNTTIPHEEIIEVDSSSYSGISQLNLIKRNVGLPLREENLRKRSIGGREPSDIFLEVLSVETRIALGYRVSLRERIKNWVDDRIDQVKRGAESIVHDIRNSEVLNTAREKIVDFIQENTPIGSIRRLIAARQELNENPDDRLATSEFRWAVGEFALDTLTFPAHIALTLMRIVRGG